MTDRGWISISITTKWWRMGARPGEDLPIRYASGTIDLGMVPAIVLLARRHSNVIVPAPSHVARFQDIKPCTKHRTLSIAVCVSTHDCGPDQYQSLVYFQLRGRVL